jgi:hypothetical protein
MTTIKNDNPELKKKKKKKSLKKKRIKTNSSNTVNVAELTKRLKQEKKNQDKGPVDEKGNPLPMDNPEGGDPVCIGGYKIDYQFDPLNDPINPPFRCISALKEDGDGGMANKVLEMANNPSLAVGDMMLGNGNMPTMGIGGKKPKKITRRIRRRRSRRSRRRH